MLLDLSEDQRLIVETVRKFVDIEVAPVASELDHRDEYPTAIVERLKELGLFGATIPEAYGGIGLDHTTYALVIEELARGWISIAGVINSHLIMAHAVLHFGTEEQKRAWLPRFATGERRGGLALSEADAGTDVQAIRHYAALRGTRSTPTCSGGGLCPLFRRGVHSWV